MSKALSGLRVPDTNGPFLDIQLRDTPGRLKRRGCSWKDVGCATKRGEKIDCRLKFQLYGSVVVNHKAPLFETTPDSGTLVEPDLVFGLSGDGKAKLNGGELCSSW